MQQKGTSKAYMWSDEGAWRGKGHMSACHPSNLYLFFFFLIYVHFVCCCNENEKGWDTQRGQESPSPCSLCAAATAMDKLCKFTDANVASYLHTNFFYYSFQLCKRVWLWIKFHSISVRISNVLTINTCTVALWYGVAPLLDCFILCIRYNYSVQDQHL